LPKQTERVITAQHIEQQQNHSRQEIKNAASSGRQKIPQQTEEQTHQSTLKNRKAPQLLDGGKHHSKLKKKKHHTAVKNTQAPKNIVGRRVPQQTWQQKTPQQTETENAVANGERLVGSII
jgi:hypothetical protein